MNLSRTKKRFLSAVENNPALLELTWAELEEKFRIPPTSRKGDRARKWFKRSQAYSGDLQEVSEAPKGMALKSRWQTQTKEGIKWMESYKVDSAIDVDGFRNNLINDIREFSPKVEVNKNYKSGEVMVEFAIPDFHIGRTPLDEAAKLFREVVDELITKATSFYKIDKIVFPVGNDWLNTDNLAYTTTRGTQQFDKDEWSSTFRYGWQILVEAIQKLSNIAPVEVIVVRGNHDNSKMFYIGDVLYAYFHNNQNISIDNSTDDFKFCTYGNNLIMYEHGELKPYLYPTIMADERPIEWSKSKFREVHTGHFHKEMVLDEVRGVKVRYLPSIAVESAWEKSKGYKHLRQAQVLIWHKETGLEGILLKNHIEDVRKESGQYKPRNNSRL